MPLPENATTITVYKDDRQRLTMLFGTPTHDAFRRVMETKCSHPEDQRQYTTALIPADGGALMEGQPAPRIYNVYRCALCSRFVLPGIDV